MNFFSVLFRVCLIPDSFYRVLGQRIPKVILHFVLYSLLLSLLLTYLHGTGIRKEIRSGCSGLMEQTGDFLLSPEKGLQTAKDPGKSKRFLLNSQLSLDFYPGKTLPADALEKVQTPYGLIVMDKGLLFWAENYGNAGSGKFLAAPMVFDVAETAHNRVRLQQSASQLRDFLRRHFVLTPGEKLLIPSGRFTAEKLSEQLTVMTGILLFLMILASVLFSGISTVLLYSLAQYLWWNNGGGKLRYREIFTVLVYSSFAPLLCGGLYSLLPWKFLAPQTVFLIAFFIYSCTVFRQIRKYLSGEACSCGSSGPDR